jgi:signal transduction histidine kinase
MATHNRIWRLASAAELRDRSWLRRRVPFVCHWQRDLNEAGVETQPSWTFTYGAPLFAIAVLLLTIVVALVDPDGSRPSIWSLLLIAIAALPWLQWLVLGDEGPTYTFLAMSLTPVFLLALGRWFVDAFSLGSDLASPLLAVPCLLVTGLTIAFGRLRIAIVTAVTAYLAFGGPLIAAWLTDRDADALAVGSWNVIFILTVAAAHAMLLNYRAGLAIMEAREARAWQAASEERRQVARDVHDVLAHTMSVTMLHITAARMAVLRSNPEDALEALEEAERHGRASLTDVRRMVRLLRSDDASALDASQPGLADVEQLVEGYRVAGLPIDFSLSMNGGQPAPLAETAMFRVLQEALTNAARHGGGAANVALTVSDREMVLQVANPVGKAPARHSHGSGLIGMRERVIAAGGSFHAGARQGMWEVRAVVPNGAGA